MNSSSLYRNVCSWLLRLWLTVRPLTHQPLTIEALWWWKNAPHLILVVYSASGQHPSYCPSAQTTTTIPLRPRNWRIRSRCRADSRFAPSQWETALLCNDVSHWLDASLESVLRCDEGRVKASDGDDELSVCFIVRRAGLLLSQQDFEWRWSVPLFQCLTVLEFSFILFDLCLLITFFNFIMNYVPIVTFWIFTYHKIWILSIMFCFIWSYWIIFF